MSFWNREIESIIISESILFIFPFSKFNPSFYKWGNWMSKGKF